jgi:deferrochelatase/peroxidase EfeB
MSDQKCPFAQRVAPPDASGPSRRGLLLGLGLASGGAVIGSLVSTARADQAVPAPVVGSTTDRQPFYGLHQAGILTPRPEAAFLAAFDVLASSRDELARLFQSLTQRIAFLTQGGPAEMADPGFPPPDSGLLGPLIAPDNLTITVGVGSSLFDGRFGLTAVKPAHLERMPQFSNDALDDAISHGDLLLQICSNSPETNVHALRDIIKHHPDLLVLRWKQDGFFQSRGAEQATQRNLLGFKDGTANPDTTSAATMDRVVWVQPNAGEPAWATGGSYQVVRVVRQFLERWDRTPLRGQQNIFGRDKTTGAPLTLTGEYDIPDYAADPTGARIPLDAHIRRANPRTPATEANLILRRSYNYSRGATSAGQLDMGLLFVAYQANLALGFAAVQARLNGEPLEEYIKPIGGGYFFALPGVADARGYLGQTLLAAG